VKILVVGGSSFSGTAFIALARTAGHWVTDLSRPDFDLNGNLPQAAGAMIDVGYENVVNFAALNMVGESWEHAADYYRTNLAGIAALAAAADGRRLRRFVQVSTPEVYGTTETYLKEGAPFRPSTPYANSRAAADAHLALLHRQFGFPVCFTRTVNVYGPGQQPYRIVPKTAVCALSGKVLPLHGGGHSTRSFIHVRDAMNAVLRVLEDGRDGETYHVATSRETTIRDLVGMVAERCGKRLGEVAVDALDRPGKDLAYQLDDAKIRAELGWSDVVPLEAGLDEAVDWVRRNLGSIGEAAYRHKP